MNYELLKIDLTKQGIQNFGSKNSHKEDESIDRNSEDQTRLEGRLRQEICGETNTKDSSGGYN